MALADQATALLLLTEVSVESLHHLRDRVPELAARVGDPSREVNPVAVVVAARSQDAPAVLQQVSRVLESVGSPVPVLGSLAVDPHAARLLRQGQITLRMGRGDLLRSAGDLTAAVIRRWPHLADTPTATVEAVTP